MALQLVSKPIGHKLSESIVTASIINDGTGTALVYTDFAHSLVDGDYVYIDSNFDSYNGFKYVDSISYDGFRIKDSENGNPVEYVQDADISYRTSVLQHGWQCVHLPIVYELESDLYPTNTIEDSYTPRLVDFVGNVNGYTGILGTSNFINVNTLDFIELVGIGPLAGVYQIIKRIDADEIVIDLAYDASNSFSGYELRKYYNNYAVNVSVMAGYQIDHRWQSVKPFELAATLQLIPDQNNRVKFSISEVLRSYINTRNNLTLDTLPNNTDFTVSFYIKYSEIYDTSDGAEISTFEGTVTTDSFVGHAVNAKLPFKSEAVSFLSDYINEDVYLAKWLTLQERPVAVVGRFFDLSFINTLPLVDILITTNGGLTQTIPNPGIGVIRVPLEFLYAGEYCIKAISGSYGGFIPAALPSLITWTNINTAGPAWVISSNPYVDFDGLGATVTSDLLRAPYSFIAGVTYDFDYEFYCPNPTATFTIKTFNASFVELTSTDVVISLVNQLGTFTVVALPGASYIGISVFHSPSCGSGSGFCRKHILSFNNVTPTVPPILASVEVTESICIDVVSECETTFIVTPDDIRLTEDGDFRILE